MAQGGFYRITSIDEGPPEETQEEVEYDYGGHTFSSRKVAITEAKRIFPRGGYRIWKMPIHNSWYSDWELTHEERYKKTG